MEYLILEWRNFLFYLKKDYLFELIRFKEISNFFAPNKISLTKLKTNHSSLLFFFNIPFSFSFLVSEIFVSITKKTIYLYRLFFFLSLPFLIFFINQTFVVKDQKDYLFFLLQKNKKVGFSKQEGEGKTKKKFLSLISLRKNGFNNNNIRMLFKNLKDSTLVKQDFSLFCNERRSYRASYHMSYLAFFFNIYQKKSFFIPFSLRASFYQRMTKIFIYGKFLILNNLEVEKNSNYGLGHTPKKMLMFSKWFFSSLELKKNNLVHFFLENSLQRQNYILEENKRKKRFLHKSQLSFHSLDFFEFFRFFSFWTLRENNKNFAKGNFFQKVESPFFSLIQPNYFNWLNDFLAPISSDFFLSLKNQQPFVFRYYQNALKSHLITSERYSNSNSLLFSFLNQSYSLENFPTYNKKFKKKRCLNNISSNFSTNTFFGNSEFFHFVSNRAKIISEIYERKKNNRAIKTTENTYLNPVNFYFQIKNYNEHSFWIPNSLIQEYLLEKKEYSQLVNSSQTSDLSSFQEDLKFLKKKREKVQNINILSKKKFLSNYNDWFFTSDWWIFQKHVFITEFESIMESLKSNFQSSFQNFFIKIGSKQIIDLLSAQKFIKIFNLTEFQSQDWDNVFVEQIYTTEEEEKNPIWRNLKLVRPVNNSAWSLFAWSMSNSIVYYHWISMVTGIFYLFLWLDSEKIRSLNYPSWTTFLSIKTHNSFYYPSQELKLISYSSRSRIFLILIHFFKIYKRAFFIFNRLNWIATVDLWRRSKNLVSNSLITNKTISTKDYLGNINKKKTNSSAWISSSLNGFTLFQQWSEKNCRIPKFLPLLKSFGWNWLSDLSFYNKNLIYDLNNPSIKPYRGWKLKPKPLFESLPYVKRWLFIGSLDSGKYFLIKNIAAGTDYPLIHLSIQDIKNATPENKYLIINKQKRWVEQLSERGFLLENIFQLAKMVSPSIFWISDLHNFDTKNYIQEKNTKNFNLSLLKASLLKVLNLELGREEQNQIIFIGSTEYPKLLDPKFVSRQRLDLIVNFRTPSFKQRQNIFLYLFKNKGLDISGLRSYSEFTSPTLGYTFQDITSLVNEILLVKTTEKTTLLDSSTIRLALSRQTSIYSLKYNKIIKDNLSYKIGKSLVQALLVYPKSIIHLSKYYDLWKTKFYYLSSTYLEISNKKEIITDFVLLSQIVNCLAGSAARDAWIISTNKDVLSKRVKFAFSLTSKLKQDLLLASNLLQSLLIEFPMQDIIYLPSKKEKDPNFYLNFLREAMSSFEFLDQFPSYINWSILENRLSFNWSLFFNKIEHSTKNSSKLLFFDKSAKRALLPLFVNNSSVYREYPYKRQESRRQPQKSQHTQKIALLFNELIYNMYMESLGFPWKSQHLINFNPFQFSIFFREARSLWNPPTLMPSYSILFFNRDLFINQKLLAKLYITFGKQFQNEKLSIERIKKQNYWSNFSFTSVDPHKIYEKENDFGNDQISPNETYSLDFHFYQNLIYLNGQLDQSQIQLPGYLHQEWVTADPTEIYRVFEILASPSLIKNDYLIVKESLLSKLLLEIYHYLIKFFLKKRAIISQIHGLFIKKETLCREDIETVLKKSF